MFSTGCINATPLVASWLIGSFAILTGCASCPQGSVQVGQSAVPPPSPLTLACPMDALSFSVRAEIGEPAIVSIYKYGYGVWGAQSELAACDPVLLFAMFSDGVVIRRRAAQPARLIRGRLSADRTTGFLQRLEELTAPLDGNPHNLVKDMPFTVVTRTDPGSRPEHLLMVADTLDDLRTTPSDEPSKPDPEPGADPAAEAHTTDPSLIRNQILAAIKSLDLLDPHEIDEQFVQPTRWQALQGSRIEPAVRNSRPRQSPLGRRANKTSSTAVFQILGSAEGSLRDARRHEGTEARRERASLLTYPRPLSLWYVGRVEGSRVCLKRHRYQVVWATKRCLYRYRANLLG